MTKQIKVLLIDPEKREVTEHMWPHNDWQWVYKLIGVSMTDLVRIPNKERTRYEGYLIVDDMGLHRNVQYRFMWRYPGALVGKAMFFALDFNDPEADAVDTTLKAEDVAREIEWLDTYAVHGKVKK